MKITIQWCESKVSSKGTDYKKCSIVDESGRKLEDVAVFSSFNHYSAIMPGAEVEGVIEQKTYNNKISYSLGNMVSTAYTRSSGPSRSSQMVKIMDKKAENIATAQENKELGIKISSTLRMAVDLAIAQVGNSAIPITTDAIQKWRTWLWLEWDKEDKDFPPFN